MITFMLSVLGSVIFWSIYISLSFFIAASLCKNKDKRKGSELINILVRKRYMMNHGDEREANTVEIFYCIILFLVLMCLWPLWIVGYLFAYIFKYTFKFLEWIIALGLEKTPTFEVKLEKENKE